VERELIYMPTLDGEEEDIVELDRLLHLPF